MGKLLYNVKELEKWQVLPYLMGMAGAGKSTICETIKEFYEPTDVGILENTIEEKFGLAPISGKYIVLAPEIKKNFSLNQALFQKIISGEECALAQKNKDPLQIVWNSPMFMASNEPPGFVDSAGSISRRLIVFKFLNIVRTEDSDPDLMGKLHLELSAIIKKVNCGYLSTVNDHSKKDIWNILPHYFKLTRDLLGQETNSLKHLLGSGMIEFGKPGETEIYCPEKEFKELYKKYCFDNGLPKPSWSPSIYEGPFAELGNINKIKIDIVKDTSRKYPRDSGTKRKMIYITGIDIIKEEKEQTDLLF